MIKVQPKKKTDLCLYMCPYVLFLVYLVHVSVPNVTVKITRDGHLITASLHIKRTHANCRVTCSQSINRHNTVYLIIASCGHLPPSPRIWQFACINGELINAKYGHPRNTENKRLIRTFKLRPHCIASTQLHREAARSQNRDTSKRVVLRRVYEDVTLHAAT